MAGVERYRGDRRARLTVRPLYHLWFAYRFAQTTKMSSEKASLLEGQGQCSPTATRVLKKIGRGVAGTLGIPLKESQSVSFYVYKDLWFL